MNPFSTDKDMAVGVVSFQLKFFTILSLIVWINQLARFETIFLKFQVNYELVKFYSKCEDGF